MDELDAYLRSFEAAVKLHGAREAARAFLQICHRKHRAGQLPPLKESTVKYKQRRGLLPGVMQRGSKKDPTPNLLLATVQGGKGNTFTITEDGTTVGFSTDQHPNSKKTYRELARIHATGSYRNGTPRVILAAPRGEEIEEISNAAVRGVERGLVMAQF